jgi:hypothetical protein
MKFSSARVFVVILLIIKEASIKVLLSVNDDD